MGKRDFRHRESKKPKKSEKEKKAITVTIVPSTPPVEVIKKGKTEKETEE